MKNLTDTTSYAQMGIAALLPGMTHMVELMQGELDRMRAMLAGMQNGNGAKRPSRGTDEYRAYDREAHRRARARKKSDPGGLNAKDKPIRDSYWASMTAEERSAEMKRRQAIAAGKKKLHPRDVAHPEHAAWAAKLSKARKKAWARLTPEEQKAKLAHMAAGQRRNAA